MDKQQLENAAARLEVALADWRLGITGLLEPPQLAEEQVRLPGGPPVVVLPGVWERWTATWQWAVALHGAGFDVHFVPELDLELGDVQALGQRLLDWLGDNLVQHPIIVAHSKGGLVAKAALIADPEAIKGVIACGTPFEGAPIVKLTPLALRLRGLSPDSTQIRRLAESTAENEKIVAIEAAWDQNVPPVGQLPGSTLLEAPAIGHNQLLQDPETAELIVEVAEQINADW